MQEVEVQPLGGIEDQKYQGHRHGVGRHGVFLLESLEEVRREPE